jgi:nucleotide-binding universal stress UspA family protein
MKNPNTQPILCGTDFSENAMRATNAAAALATRLNAPLWLVHVTSEPLPADIPAAVKSSTAWEPMRSRLLMEAERLRSLGAMVEERMTTGTADEELAGLAERFSARLVVVSSLGRRAPARWLIGSVAERTAESSPVPTLIVRDAAPFEAWGRGERALKVFVGTDFTASSDAALRWVAELRQIGPCEVVVGYVDWPPEEAARLGVSGAIGLSGNLPEMQRVLERDLREKVTRVLGEENVQVRVVGNWGRAEFPLVEMAIEAQADLVVVGTRQCQGLDRMRTRSVSRGILRHAPMSVACVPAPAAAPMAGPRIRECQRVLVAVDLNEPHGFAAPYGYSIVQPGGTVRLLHNIMPFRLPNPMIGGYYQDFPTPKEQAQLVAAAEAKLRALAPHAAEARGIVTEVEVTESRETAEAICAAAERFGADVICIGSHTRPGFTAKVLGSVSLAVLQGSRRPVLVVWPPAE